ncbi:MAG: hypothetical protein LBT46_03835 [Planctomycetaceae bacterium]|jgi:hypothetical protein|nr:hypothetical protein [Planctomycetaceae bacterium]
MPNTIPPEIYAQIYLDNCTYNRPFDKKEQITVQMEAEAKLHIQSGIVSGKFVLFDSR